MVDHVVLHIGTMKSGTTFLQHVLATLRPRLEALGWRYPRTWAQGDVPNQQLAFYGLLGLRVPWVSAVQAQGLLGDARRLRQQLASWSGPVVLSSEALASLDDEGVEACLATFGDTPVEVVVTSRDLGRVLPSWWQQSVRGGDATPYETVLERLERAREDDTAGGVGATFWRSFRLAPMVGRWVKRVGAEQVTVVTVPCEGGPSVLWQRFHAAAGFPEGVPLEPPAVPRDLSNVGLTASEALVVRPFVEGLNGTGESLLRRKVLVQTLVRDALLDRDDRGPALGVPPAWLERVTTWAEQDLAELEALGLRLVGEPDDLLVRPERVVHPEPSVHHVADAGAALALATVRAHPTRPHFALRRLAQLRRRVVRALRRDPTGADR